MSTMPVRAAMVPITRRMRAYFAPVNRTTETPTLFRSGEVRIVRTGPAAGAMD